MQPPFQRIPAVETNSTEQELSATSAIETDKKEVTAPPAMDAIIQAFIIEAHEALDKSAVESKENKVSDRSPTPLHYWQDDGPSTETSASTMVTEGRKIVYTAYWATKVGALLKEAFSLSSDTCPVQLGKKELSNSPSAITPRGEDPSPLTSAAKSIDEKLPATYIIEADENETIAGTWAASVQALVTRVQTLSHETSPQELDNHENCDSPRHVILQGGGPPPETSTSAMELFQVTGSTRLQAGSTPGESEDTEWDISPSPLFDFLDRPSPEVKGEIDRLQAMQDCLDGLRDKLRKDLNRRERELVNLESPLEAFVDLTGDFPNWFDIDGVLRCAQSDADMTNTAGNLRALGDLDSLERQMEINRIRRDQHVMHLNQVGDVLACFQEFVGPGVMKDVWEAMSLQDWAWVVADAGVRFWNGLRGPMDGAEGEGIPGPTVGDLNGASGVGAPGPAAKMLEEMVGVLLLVTVEMDKEVRDRVDARFGIERGEEMRAGPV